MSDKELDEILKEIKERSKEDSPVPSADAGAEAVNEIAEEALTAPEETAEVPAQEEEVSAENVPPQENFIIEEEPIETEPPAESETVPEEKAEGNFDIMAVAENTQDELPVVETETATNIMDAEPPKKSKKGVIIGILAAVIVIALGVGAYLYFNGYFNHEEPTTTQPAVTETTTEPIKIDTNLSNPLTGEKGFNTAAIGKRPVAVVVENEYSTSSVRPQWGIAEADMIMEGETEYSTRMLFFWADMMSMPDEIGPSRSARPPFIRFSQLWDSIFIHTGLSHSKDNYEGADTVFENENIDHINLLSLSEDGTYFGRDNSRKTAVEHTGYLNGKNVSQLISNSKINTELREERFTRFEFNDEAQPLSDTEAEKATFVWSNRCPKKGVFTYDAEKGKYVTEDFDSRYGTAGLEVETLIYLLDETEYIVKENYKGSGKSETYCDYHLSGGEGKVLSEGTVVDITWSKEDGKLVLKTKDGETLKLNPGKIYIGYGSSNNGGSITVE